MKRDQGIGESREGLVRGLVGKQEPLSWDSCLLLRGEKGRPLQVTWGKELWGSCLPFLGDTISLTANPLILWLVVSFPIFMPWSTGNWWMQRAGATTVFPWEELISGLYSTKGQPWKHPHKQHHPDREGFVYESKNIYVYTYMYEPIWKTEQGGVHGKA